MVLHRILLGEPNKTTGGFVNIYVDTHGNFLITNQATAADGTLWLSLNSHSIFGISAEVESPLTTLIATFAGAGATGLGLLDVAGESAEQQILIPIHDLAARISNSKIALPQVQVINSEVVISSEARLVYRNRLGCAPVGIGLLGSSFSRAPQMIRILLFFP